MPGCAAALTVPRGISTRRSACLRLAYHRSRRDPDASGHARYGPASARRRSRCALPASGRPTTATGHAVPAGYEPAPTPPLSTMCLGHLGPVIWTPCPYCPRCFHDQSGCGLAAERPWCATLRSPYSLLAHPRLGFSGVDATRTNPRYLASVARLGLGVALASDSCRASCLGRHGGVASLAAGPACNGRPARRLSSPSAHAHSSPCLPFAARAGPGALLAQSRP